jgi:hypothetical protein
MQLSILIPAIPERWAIGQRLFTKLLKMCEGKEIEILYFMDNKKRTCGEKMESLKNISNGKYFMFCHDDDDILRIDEVYQATFQDVDVITFKQLCDSPNEAKTPYVVTFGLGNPIDRPEDFNGPIPGSFLDMRRPPWSVCAWNQKFKSIPYKGIYAEDGDWVERALVEAKTEVFLDVIVCRYCFDPYNTSDPNTRRERPSGRPEPQKPFQFIRRM